MTPEQKEIARVKRKNLQDKYRREMILAKYKKGDRLSSTHLPGETPEFTGVDWGGMLSATQDASILGGGNEVANYLSAAITKGLGYNEGKDVGELYDEFQGESDETNRTFRSQSPGGNLVSTVAGAGLTLPFSATAQVAKALPASAGRLKQAAAIVPTAAAEGAAVGALSSYQGERLQGAGLGAIIGGTLSSGGAAAREVGDFVSKRRVGPEITKDFPITAAAEGSRIAEFFKKGPGTSWGGGELRRQHRNLLNRAEDAVEAAKKTTKFTRRASQDVKTLRSDAVAQSVPHGTPKEVVNELKLMDPHEANKALDSIWKQYGFREVKDRDFQLNTDEIRNEVFASLDNAMQSKYGQELNSYLESMFNQHMRFNKKPPATKFSMTPQMKVKANVGEKAPTGNIDGEDLISMRNTMRMNASREAETGFGRVQADADNKVAAIIDRKIKEQLGDKADQYENSLANYGIRRTYDDATIAATNANKQGLWGPEEWITGMKKYSGKTPGRGEGPLQQDAYTTQNKLNAADTAKKESIEKATKFQKRAQRSSPQLEPSWWTRNYQAGMLGLGLPPVGAAVARGLTSQGGQRMAGGQTGWQKMLAEILKDPKFAEKAARPGDLIRRSAEMNYEGDE